jgi:hypothetical protein
MSVILARHSGVSPNFTWVVGGVVVAVVVAAVVDDACVGCRSRVPWD